MNQKKPKPTRKERRIARNAKKYTPNDDKSLTAQVGRMERSLKHKSTKWWHFMYKAKMRRGIKNRQEILDFHASENLRRTQPATERVLANA
jgi:hypothetical protein